MPSIALAFSSNLIIRSANQLLYDNSPRAGRGVGKEQWGSKALYILHPVGFTFNESSASYSKSGLTIAQLRAGGRYALAVPAKHQWIS
jgi:hypothetical protein